MILETDHKKASLLEFVDEVEERCGGNLAKNTMRRMLTSKPISGQWRGCYSFLKF
jgi:hypothetical protein